MNDSPLSPVSVLTSLLAGEIAQLQIITGSSGAGKTSWCSRFVSIARKAGMRPKGLLSPALFVDGIKAGIDLVNIESQERRHLATPKNKGSTPTHHWSPSETPGWIFDSKTMLWGNRVLKSLSSCDLLFIDELGPIEFHSDTGLAAGMDLIGQRAYQNAFVVIRPSLVPEAQERWPWARLMDITGLMIKPDDLVK